MEIVHSFPSSDIGAEVDGCGSAAYLVGQYRPACSLYTGGLEASLAVQLFQ